VSATVPNNSKAALRNSGGFLFFADGACHPVVFYDRGHESAPGAQLSKSFGAVPSSLNGAEKPGHFFVAKIGSTDWNDSFPNL